MLATTDLVRCDVRTAVGGPVPPLPKRGLVSGITASLAERGVGLRERRSCCRGFGRDAVRAIPCYDGRVPFFQPREARCVSTVPDQMRPSLSPLSRRRWRG